MASWPSSLPKTPLLDGYSEEEEDSRIISEVDAGARKVRNRYRATIENVSESYLLTGAQYKTLKSFYKNTLSNGADAFTKYNPIEEQTLLYRFGKGKYKLDSVSYPYYRVTLELEILPE